jgi:hypothetical protein
VEYFLFSIILDILSVEVIDMGDIIAYWIIGLLLFVVIRISQRDKRVIGNLGESIIKSKLRELGDEFVVLHDVRYKKCQIDHLVINHAAKIVFVIETKMWGGIITGEVNDKKWRQDKNGQVMYYDNPVLQNKYHCRIVRQKYSGYSVRSVVVFVRCKSIPRHSNVMIEDELVEYINRVSNKVYNRVIIDSETGWLSQSPKHM